MPGRGRPSKPHAALNLSVAPELAAQVRTAAQIRGTTVSATAAYLLDGGMRLWLAQRARGRIELAV